MTPFYSYASRRRLLQGLVLSATVLMAATGAARAAWPERPVTLVVTYPPGGTVDLVARLIGPKLADKLGQSIVIENRGGAGGMIGGAAVAKAQPDGYTLMMDASNHAQNPVLQSKMAFDTLTDFVPVSLLLRVPTVLVVTPSSTIQSVADLVAQGRAESGTPVYFASSGPGSSTHLAGELFNLLAGTALEHVPYKGGGPAMIDVMAGQVPVMFASMGSASQHIRNGKLRAIAVGGEARSPAAPDLPTLAESGVPGYAAYEWNAVFAPAGTPAAVIDTLSRALAEVLQDPAVLETLSGIGAEPIGSTPAELEAFRRAEIDKWRNVVAQTGLKMD